MREKIKYIRQTEERKFLEKNPAERNREREREMNIQSACGPSCGSSKALSDDEDKKNCV